MHSNFAAYFTFYHVCPSLFVPHSQNHFFPRSPFPPQHHTRMPPLASPSSPPNVHTLLSHLPREAHRPTRSLLTHLQKIYTQQTPSPSEIDALQRIIANTHRKKYIHSVPKQPLNSKETYSILGEESQKIANQITTWKLLPEFIKGWVKKFVPWSK